MNEIIATPDAMLDDPDSMVFYVLRNEELALCKREMDLPYHKKRETYLSCGRYSPKHQKVVFWPGAVNPSRAVQLLTENLYITSSYTWHVSGATTRVKVTKLDGDPRFSRHDAIKRNALKNLVERRGMKIQGCKDQDQK